MTPPPSYSFSFAVESFGTGTFEDPAEGIAVPIEIFSSAPTMQALARYLRDHLGLSLREAGALLARSPQSIWSSYNQGAPLEAPRDPQLEIPLSIFSGPLAPLESLVEYLRGRGLRNSEIARLLGLSPKTTHTAHKRAEVKRNG